jgi:hypothetical protein
VDCMQAGKPHDALKPAWDRVLVACAVCKHASFCHKALQRQLTESSQQHNGGLHQPLDTAAATSGTSDPGASQAAPAQKSAHDANQARQACYGPLRAPLHIHRAVSAPVECEGVA